jgi:N-acetylglucosamine-6-sulfatase
VSIRGRNHLGWLGFLIGVRDGRGHRAGFVLLALCAAAGACTATPALGFPSAVEAGRDAPAARAAAKCDAECRADRRRERLRKLRRQNAKQQRPNVILIDTDDQNVADMSVMRNTLNLLGGRGTTFRNSFVSYPLCCPSRATHLSGQYAHNHGVFSDQQYSAFDNTNTLAVWLRHARYRTAMVGKYLNGYGLINRREIPSGWTQWFALTGGTEQKRYRYNLNENGKVQYYRNGVKNYVTDVLSSKVNTLLREWAISPKPFFIYFNPTAPHGERAVPIFSTRDPQPAPRHLGVFGEITAPKSPNFNEPDVSDKPKVLRNMPQLSDPLLADLDRRHRGRLESLLAVDDEVKKMVGLIRKYGDKRKTVFIFTSDNGLEMGSHRIMFKNFLYDEAERVPLIIRGPGFPEGVNRDQPVANIDLAPTIVSIAGAVPGRVMDGIPLQPLANNPSVAANRDLLFEALDLGSPDLGQSFGIRRGDWAYNEYTNGTAVLSDHAELYDMKSDPYQLNNLLYDPPGSASPSPADVALAGQLAARLGQLRICSGASCQ